MCRLRVLERATGGEREWTGATGRARRGSLAFGGPTPTVPLKQDTLSIWRARLRVAVLPPVHVYGSALSGTSRTPSLARLMHAPMPAFWGKRLANLFVSLLGEREKVRAREVERTKQERCCWTDAVSETGKRTDTSVGQVFALEWEVHQARFFWGSSVAARRRSRASAAPRRLTHTQSPL